MRLLTIVSGILFILTGAFCFAKQGETFLALAFLVGIIMVASSLIQIMAYLYGRSGDKGDRNGWIMTEALTTFILGTLVVANQISADVAIPMVFGMWTMFSGILRFVTSTYINRNRKRSNFWWTMIVGLLCTTAGIYAFLNPVTLMLPIAILLGALFSLQGVSLLELGIHMPHEKRR